MTCYYGVVSYVSAVSRKNTDFSSINSFARALVGLNFSDYCDN